MDTWSDKRVMLISKVWVKLLHFHYILKEAEWAHLPAFLTGSGILNDLLSSTAWLTFPKQSAVYLSPSAFNSTAASK